VVTADDERSREIFLIEKIGVELGNIRMSLYQLRCHVLDNGDLRTRVTLDVAVKRLQDIQDESRRLSTKFSSSIPTHDVECSVWAQSQRYRAE